MLSYSRKITPLGSLRCIFKLSCLQWRNQVYSKVNKNVLEVKRSLTDTKLNRNTNPWPTTIASSRTWNDLTRKLHENMARRRRRASSCESVAIAGARWRCRRMRMWWPWQLASLKSRNEGEWWEMARKAYDEDRFDPRWRKTSAIDVMFAEKYKEIFCYVNSLISSF
jgi:hypothetical protein